jgi:hypothetical protein
MINNIIKTAPKTNTTVKFWEAFMEEVKNKAYEAESLIPLPYKEIKELAEESKNPMTALPKLSLSIKKEDQPWYLHIFALPSETKEIKDFSSLLLDDYILELFK